jgi:hypothetical protein
VKNLINELNLIACMEEKYMINDRVQDSTEYISEM